VKNEWGSCTVAAIQHARVFVQRSGYSGNQHVLDSNTLAGAALVANDIV